LASWANDAVLDGNNLFMRYLRGTDAHRSADFIVYEGAVMAGMVNKK
jgi:hypothetical protein